MYRRKVAREAAAKALVDLKKRGMQVHELTPQEVAKLRERPAIDKLTVQVGEPLGQGNHGGGEGGSDGPGRG